MSKHLRFDVNLIEISGRSGKHIDVEITTDCPQEIINEFEPKEIINEFEPKEIIEDYDNLEELYELLKEKFDS